MTQLKTMYRQIILDHYKKPRYQGEITEKYALIHMKNPSCGDAITLGVNVLEDDTLDIRHEGSGCSICCASASVMSELLHGKTKEEALRLSLEFSKMLLGKPFDREGLDEAIAFEGVQDFPARMKCATLSWKALEKALKEDSNGRQ